MATATKNFKIVKVVTKGETLYRPAAQTTSASFGCIPIFEPVPQPDTTQEFPEVTYTLELTENEAQALRALIGAVFPSGSALACLTERVFFALATVGVSTTPSAACPPTVLFPSI